MKELIQARIKASLNVKEQLLENKELISIIHEVSKVCTGALADGNKILFCGNGGSAAEAQHLAAEFSGRFYKDRDPLFAEALHVNSSYLTAVANDYSFEEVYARITQAKGRRGDILIGISTSGNSRNILLALEKAKELNMHTVGLTGMNGGEMKGSCEYLINVPSIDTPRIQECHLLIGHIICELVEASLF